MPPRIFAQHSGSIRGAGGGEEEVKEEDEEKEEEEKEEEEKEEEEEEEEGEEEREGEEATHEGDISVSQAKTASNIISLCRLRLPPSPFPPSVHPPPLKSNPRAYIRFAISCTWLGTTGSSLFSLIISSWARARREGGRDGGREGRREGKVATACTRRAKGGRGSAWAERAAVVMMKFRTSL